MKINIVGSRSIGSEYMSASYVIDNHILIDVPNGIIKYLKKLGYDILNINEWVTKIIMTLIVLVYNYATRKLIIYKKLPNKQQIKALETKEEKTDKDKQFATNLNLIQNIENENH